MAWLFGLGGVGVLALAWIKRGSLVSLFGKAVDAGQSLAFSAVLPPGVRLYADEILAASRKYGVSPWLIAGVMYRESSGGTSLRPPGPGGTGDFLARSPSSTYFKYADPSTGLPPDGLGWGRGLMQIDYGANNAWVQSHNWADPQTNIDYATALLAQNQSFFTRAAGADVPIDNWRITQGYSAGGKQLVAPWSTLGVDPSTTSAPDPRPLDGDDLAAATLAAYNGGQSGALQALAVGLSPAKATSNGEYADWILSHVATWMSKFP